MNNIPKLIHYCWFGKKEKPYKVRMCIKTWKEKLPDYEIIEWNENNFDVQAYDFTKKAYESKKWAFVSDYCRILALYNNGGIYLDTDIEVIKNIDKFLEQKSFGGIEHEIYINGAIWGCREGDQFIKKLIDYYNKLNFYDFNGDLFRIAIPKIITEIAKDEGYNMCNRMQELKGGTVVYPSEYFYPKGHSWEKSIITENTYTIHHYDGSWKNPIQIYRTKLKQILINIFGYDRIINLTSKIKN